MRLFFLLQDFLQAGMSIGKKFTIFGLRLYDHCVSLVKADKWYCGVDAGIDGCLVQCVK